MKKKLIGLSVGILSLSSITLGFSDTFPTFYHNALNNIQNLLSDWQGVDLSKPVTVSGTMSFVGSGGTTISLEDGTNKRSTDLSFDMPYTLSSDIAGQKFIAQFKPTVKFQGGEQGDFYSKDKVSGYGDLEIRVVGDQLSMVVHDFSFPDTLLKERNIDAKKLADIKNLIINKSIILETGMKENFWPYMNELSKEQNNNNQMKGVIIKLLQDNPLFVVTKEQQQGDNMKISVSLNKKGIRSLLSKYEGDGGIYAGVSDDRVIPYTDTVINNIMEMLDELLDTPVKGIYTTKDETLRLTIGKLTEQIKINRSVKGLSLVVNQKRTYKNTNMKSQILYGPTVFSAQSSFLEKYKDTQDIDESYNDTTAMNFSGNIIVLSPTSVSMGLGLLYQEDDIKASGISKLTMNVSYPSSLYVNTSYPQVLGSDLEHTINTMTLSDEQKLDENYYSLSTIHYALDNYYEENNNYPSSLNTLISEGYLTELPYFYTIASPFHKQYPQGYLYKLLPIDDYKKGYILTTQTTIDNANFIDTGNTLSTQPWKSLFKTADTYCNPYNCVEACSDRADCNPPQQFHNENTNDLRTVFFGEDPNGNIPIVQISGILTSGQMVELGIDTIASESHISALFFGDFNDTTSSKLYNNIIYNEYERLSSIVPEFTGDVSPYNFISPQIGFHWIDINHNKDSQKILSLYQCSDHYSLYSFFNTTSEDITSSILSSMSLKNRVTTKSCMKNNDIKTIIDTYNSQAKLLNITQPSIVIINDQTNKYITIQGVGPLSLYKKSVQSLLN